MQDKGYFVYWKDTRQALRVHSIEARPGPWGSYLSLTCDSGDGVPRRLPIWWCQSPTAEDFSHFLEELRGLPGWEDRFANIAFRGLREARERLLHKADELRRASIRAGR